MMQRRKFINSASTGALGILTLGQDFDAFAQTLLPKYKTKMKFGFVTYLWGKDMKLPDLISSCEKAGMLGVETRTQHAHGVEPSLNSNERSEVKKRFSDSPVALIGYGSNSQYHDADQKKLKANIELTKSYIKLMHDCGGSGVKVKPNGFPKGVSREKTIEQIGKALNEVAAFGDDYGQEIRVEVHGGGTSDLEVMKAIFDVADHPNATICWNCNSQDLKGKGLKHNFNLVKKRFGKTLHVRELDSEGYPYQDLFDNLVSIKYDRWVLLEARTNPANKLKAMKHQKSLFQKLLKNANH